MMSVPGFTILTMLIRWALTAAGAFLVGHHVISTADVPAFIQDGIGVAAALGSLAWSYRDKLAVELRAALASLTGHAKPDMKDPQVQAVAAMIKAPSTPPAAAV